MEENLDKPAQRIREESKAVKQEDSMGCGVACVAYVLRMTYQEALALFENGADKANTVGFFCSDIVHVLTQAGIKGVWYRNASPLIPSNSIVFLGKSKRYPQGHYLARTGNKRWMDPWINFPNEKIEAGYRDELPDRPAYSIEFAPTPRR